MEDINQKANDMQIKEEEGEVNEIDRFIQEHELPQFNNEESFRAHLRRLGINVEEVYNPANRTKSDDCTPQTGFTLVPVGWGRSCCFLPYGPDVVKLLVIPCADQALADFNKKHNTDYKLAEGFNDACLRQKFHMGCYKIHCNFTAEPETKPLDDGVFYRKNFFVDADRNADRSINLNSYSLLDYDGIKYGCEMCPSFFRHPASDSRKALGLGAELGYDGTC